MNEYDSNRILNLVKKAGYSKTENLNDLDCYILNTCHIREKATEKVYHDIGRLKKYFKNKKKPIVLVTGCVAQAENNVMLEREPYIDAVIGPQSYHNLSKILLKLNEKRNRLNFTDFDVIEDDEESVQDVTIRVCDSLTCELFGSETLIKELKGNLDKKKVRVLRAPCMGLCDKAPACDVGHNHVNFSHLEKILEVL